MTKIYSVAEAAEVAHVSLWTVYTAIRRGRLKAKGKYRKQIRASELRRWIED